MSSRWCVLGDFFYPPFWSPTFNHSWQYLSKIWVFILGRIPIVLYDNWFSNLSSIFLNSSVVCEQCIIHNILLYFFPVSLVYICKHWWTTSFTMFSNLYFILLMYINTNLNFWHFFRHKPCHFGSKNFRDLLVKNQVKKARGW